MSSTTRTWCSWSRRSETDAERAARRALAARRRRCTIYRTVRRAIGIGASALHLIYTHRGHRLKNRGIADYFFPTRYSSAEAENTTVYPRVPGPGWAGRPDPTGHRRAPPRPRRAPPAPGHTHQHTRSASHPPEAQTGTTWNTRTRVCHCVPGRHAHMLAAPSTIHRSSPHIRIERYRSTGLRGPGHDPISHPPPPRQPRPSARSRLPGASPSLRGRGSERRLRLSRPPAALS